MIDFLISMPMIIGLPIFMVIVVVFGALVYVGAHSLLKNHIKKEHERVGRVLFRTSASLLGLILSFTFANQRVDYFRLKESLVSEASALVDIHMGLELINTNEAVGIQKEIKDYIIFVSEDGWKSISLNPFDSRSVQQFQRIHKHIYELKTENEIQEQIRNNLIQDVDEVSDFLQIRMYSTRPEQFNLVYTSIFGLFVIMVLFSVYLPNRLNLIFLSLYNGFIGMLLYFILMMNNPLVGPMKIKAEPFQILQETIERDQ
ncbi:MAG: DUF4239 domain-containing protein [Saprospiraceae bacterium]|nr:DUF4239 domain-containing protein [Saprospiraceae bacterium]